MSEYAIRALDASTWDAFGRLAEKHNGMGMRASSKSSARLTSWNVVSERPDREGIPVTSSRTSLATPLRASRSRSTRICSPGSCATECACGAFPSGSWRRGATVSPRSAATCRTRRRRSPAPTGCWCSRCGATTSRPSPGSSTAASSPTSGSPGRFTSEEIECCWLTHLARNHRIGAAHSRRRRSAWPGTSKEATSRRARAT